MYLQEVADELVQLQSVISNPRTKQALLIALDLVNRAEPDLLTDRLWPTLRFFIVNTFEEKGSLAMTVKDGILSCEQETIPGKLSFSYSAQEGELTIDQKCIVRAKDGTLIELPNFQDRPDRD